MKNELSPNDKKLRQLLRESRLEPALPSNFNESVWRRVSKAQATERASRFAWLDIWLNRMLMPRFAITSLTVLLVIGGISGTINYNTQIKQKALEQYLLSVAPDLIR